MNSLSIQLIKLITTFLEFSLKSTEICMSSLCAEGLHDLSQQSSCLFYTKSPLFCIKEKWGMRRILVHFWIFWKSVAVLERLTLTQREKQMERACLVFWCLRSINSLKSEGRKGGKGRFPKERWTTLIRALECYGLCWMAVWPQECCCPAVFSL